MRRLHGSPMLRSVLALLLVCAQFFAAAHALSHVGDLVAAHRGDEPVAAVPLDPAGGLPAAERHDRCLQCLAAADLGAALPSMPPLPPANALPPALPGETAPAVAAHRQPCPPCRGPPSSV